MSELLGALVLILIVAAMGPELRRLYGSLLLVCIVLALIGLANGYQPG